MSSPAHHHNRNHHHPRPAKVHSPSTTGADKRRKLMDQHSAFGGGGGDQFHPPHHQGLAYPHHQGYYMFVPEGGEGGGGGGAIHEETPGSALPPPHGYGFAPPNHHRFGVGHHHHHQQQQQQQQHQHQHSTIDPYFVSRTGSAVGGNSSLIPPPLEGYYLCPPPHYGAPPPPPPPPPLPIMMHPASGENTAPNKIHQPRGHNSIAPPRLIPQQFTNGGGGGEDYEHSTSASKSVLKILHPHRLISTGAETSPGAIDNGDDNNENEHTSVTASDDTLDTRSPEGSRNLNPLEERVQGIVDNHQSEEQLQQQQEKEQRVSSTASDASTTSSDPSKGEQVTHMAHNPAAVLTSNNMGRMPPYHVMHPPPLPPPGMIPYHGQPPAHPGMYHPPHPHHQNRHHHHPHMPPTIMPHSPAHQSVLGYPSPTHRHHSYPAHHAAPHPPPPSHHVPGMPQFLPQFQNMRPQHHRNAQPSGGSGDSHMPQPPQDAMSPEGSRGGDRLMMPPHTYQQATMRGHLSPPQSTRAVSSTNGETSWTCEYCNLKFNTWEDCAAHEEADCPAAAYHHHHHGQRPLLQGFGPPPPGQYHPMHVLHHGGMMHPGHDNMVGSSEHIHPHGEVGRNPHNRTLKGRKMALSAFPNNGHLFVDQNAEYAVNTDRVTYLFSTASDVESLSDRQCYVRTHFVEIFIATTADVGARHSRGAQMLNLGQIGLRCAYCVKLKQRDRAERAICYPSSISRIYQTVADMQRFHFESCVAIPPKVLDAYRSLKTTRPRGVGSPQSYWDQSARDIGLVDSKNGIQVSEGYAKFEKQRKSVVTGMLAIMDGPTDASRGALIMQDMLARQEDADEEEGKKHNRISLFRQHQDPQATQVSDSTSSSIIQAAVVSSPGSDTGSKAEDEDVILGVASSTPKSANDVEAEEDANILLMLKKTPESPPRVDSSEYSSSVDNATRGKNDVDGDEITNPINAVNVDGLVAEV